MPLIKSLRLSLKTTCGARARQLIGTTPRTVVARFVIVLGFVKPDVISVPSKKFEKYGGCFEIGLHADWR